MNRAHLFKRVFDIDTQHCPHRSGGERKIIAAILERPVTQEILTHLGLDCQPPPREPARQPGRRQAGRAAATVPSLQDHATNERGTGLRARSLGDAGRRVSTMTNASG